MALLRLCHDLLNRYLNPPTWLGHVSHGPLCKANDSELQSKQRDALVLESLVGGLSGVGLWPVPLVSSDVRVDLRTLSLKLRDLICYQSPQQNYGRSHEDCTFTKTFRIEFAKVMDKIESGVLQSHLLHLEEQYKKRNSYSPRP